MIIDVSAAPALKALSLLDLGQGFIFGTVEREGAGSYFIRSAPTKGDGQLYGTRLKDGQVIGFSRDAMVAPVNLKVVAA